jgi:hypothetical protein
MIRLFADSRAQTDVLRCPPGPELTLKAREPRYDKVA